MKTLRFISLPDEAAPLNEYLEKSIYSKYLDKFREGEVRSMTAFKRLCEEYGAKFEIIGIDEFLKTKEKTGKSLLLDGDIESILYSEYWSPLLNVDGSSISKMISDKYVIYKMVKSVKEVLQPKTVYIQNYSELAGALEQIRTGTVVLKPRRDSFSSHNVLIIKRDRIEKISEGERLNFVDYLVQEYLEETLWPPQEWRFHFVGRELCRCMKIQDKNNWEKSLMITDLKVHDIPKELLDQAIAISRLLVNPKNSDNFTLDFLETKNGFIFLEANCGALGSFYISKESDFELLRPIVKRILGIN